jgi:hypothetical protein
MTMRTLTRRLAGQVVGGSALALILGGLGAHPAAAQTHKQAAKQANNESIDCLKEGGEPDASVSADGTIGTTCAYDDGSKEQCVWDASKNYLKECWVARGVPRPPDTTHGPVGGGVSASRRASGAAEHVKRRHQRHAQA